jgi:hypothetical protein
MTHEDSKTVIEDVDKLDPHNVPDLNGAHPALNHKLVHQISYKARWGSKVGKDCVSLDHALCKWLGKRLVHLGMFTDSYVEGSDYNTWRTQLIAAGVALYNYTKLHNIDDDAKRDKVISEAKSNLHWIADNLGHFWD